MSEGHKQKKRGVIQKLFVKPDGGWTLLSITLFLIALTGVIPNLFTLLFYGNTHISETLTLYGIVGGLFLLLFFIVSVYYIVSDLFKGKNKTINTTFSKLYNLYINLNDNIRYIIFVFAFILLHVLSIWLTGSTYPLWIVAGGIYLFVIRKEKGYGWMRGIIIFVMIGLLIMWINGIEVNLDQMDTEAMY